MRSSLANLLLVCGIPVCAAQADAQREALWQKMATVSDLKEVDQIIVYGDDGDMMRGMLQKRRWLKPTHIFHEKPFNAKFEQNCSLPIPECWEIRGIWSRGELIPGSD